MQLLFDWKYQIFGILFHTFGRKGWEGAFED